MTGSVNPNVVEFVSEELGLIRKKIGQIIELLGYFELEPGEPIFASLADAAAACAAAEKELSRLARPRDCLPA